MKKLLEKLRTNYPDLSFQEAATFCWSPEDKEIRYTEKSDKNEQELASWALLHEVAHAVLGHKSYVSDLDLLLLEVSAWDKAKLIATEYGLEIDNEHIQDCLDTYRDWLDLRSTCPLCGNTGMQDNQESYRCINCGQSWRVTSARFSRAYRQTKRSKKQKSPASKEVTTFA